ncbi:MAG: PssE/Cps14G family polysaccharide biosynthesis glycosyltransferase [Planctomycetota bacterium]|jgi:UDP-N-acetylglucosamine transferase subunit ALG13
MIFLTVGTSFPFNRLVKAVDRAIDRALIEEEIFAQVGAGGFKPKHIKYVEMLKKEEFDLCLRKASGLISHAGMGSITMALENHKPMLVMPRLRRYGEVVNDHQLDIARKFEQDSYILVAYGAEELPEKIRALESFVPRKRQPQPEAIAERISVFLDGLCH